MPTICRHCSASFEITDVDLAFLEKLSPVIAEKKELIPPPTLCPDCRLRQRWAVRNETSLYHRQCDLTGQNIISLYAPDSPHTVYSEEAYRGDRWDPMSYGRPYDFNRPFFEQFHELFLAVPRRGLGQDETNENCEYITGGSGNKNCYMAYACMFCEDTYYSTRCGYLHNTSDCYHVVSGELLYECINSTNCYNCTFCQDVNNCQDSLLLDHCQACSHCIACKNLRNKEYHIYNKPVSPEEFDSFRTRLLQGAMDEERAIFDRWKQQLPTPHAHLLQSENCTGDYLNSTRNCHHCFALHMDVEDCRYCQFGGLHMKDAMDGIMCGTGDLLYECMGVGPAHAVQCVTFSEEVTDSSYCTDMLHCSHCFGCTGLKHKSYCIFNTQYSKEEYPEMVSRIIAHMRTNNEYGEFFPMHFSAFPYNDTIAQEWFPLTEEELRSQGLRWQAQTDQSPDADAAREDILICEATGKPFKVTKQERGLLEHMGLPLPRLHPAERHRRRIARCNPLHLWDRECVKCHKPIATSYAPERPEIVYCESCYLASVY